MTLEAIQSIFNKHGGWARAGELKAAGLNHYHINQLLESGVLQRAGRGIYKLAGAEEDEKTLVAKKIPNGIFCLYTACQQYELSTFTPSELHVAIPQKSKHVLPDYPPVKLYYWDEKSWGTGIAEIASGNAMVKIYDVEKTICDMVRLRNKVGLDMTKEVIKNYLERGDRDLVKLLEYARILRVEKQVSNYIEILL